jgi:CubicO group peptidase (beta-lactamase class C family)
MSCATESDEPEVAQFNWEVSTPQDLNMDQELIDSALFQAGKLNYIYSFLVIRNGKIATEKYFNGHNVNSENNIRSISKSYLSATFGLAIEMGIVSESSKLTNIIQVDQSQIIDNRFNDITVGNLLKMKSGLDKDVNLYMEVVYSENWLSTIFSQRLVSIPGEKFIYSTPATHLLSAALTKASGKTSSEFVTENLLKPMDIELNDWERDPQGIYFGGNNMYFTTRNMAVLGQVYLDGGMLMNRQIVPSDWVKESVKEHTNGLGNWGVMHNIGYGYLWWLGEIENYKVFTAIGHGGQFILCVPDLDLVVATNAHSNIGWDQANAQELEILNIIGTYIIPSVKIN